MTRALTTSLCAVFLGTSMSLAKPDPGTVEPISSPFEGAATDALIEFQGEDISNAVRSLGRRANLNVFVSDQIKGTITVRLENVTPREAIETIARSKDLILDDKDGILYLREKSTRQPAESEPPKAEPSLDEAVTEALTPAVTGLYEVLLNFHARPEVAQKVARSKRLLYDALIAEGFSKDEAFRLVVAEQGISMSDFSK